MPTKIPLQSIAISSATSSVTFSNIDQTFSDLELVINGGFTSTVQSFRFQVNGDTGNNYSYSYLAGNGSAASTTRATSTSGINCYHVTANTDTALKNNVIVHLINYSNSTNFKTLLLKGAADAEVAITAGLYRGSTSPITSLTVLTTGGNLQAGTTFDLYGISPVNAKVATASGGTAIFYDSTFVYHVFDGTGTFVPTRNLSADILVVAGGGGGGAEANGGPTGGGGGAGGLRVLASQSLTANTVYTCTVGAGGIGAPVSSTSRVNNGTNSSFSGSGFTTISATAGGGGGIYGSSASLNSGAAGGSGGGSSSQGNNSSAVGGAGNAGGYSPVEGYAGGSSPNTLDGVAAGGGGAGGIGSNSTNATNAGKGGDGASVYGAIDFSSWLTVTGSGSGGKIAAGGGGGGRAGTSYPGPGIGGVGGGGSGQTALNSSGFPGLTNTGSGGAGASAGAGSGGNGGSGIIIVRYTR